MIQEVREIKLLKPTVVDEVEQIRLTVLPPVLDEISGYREQIPAILAQVDHIQTQLPDIVDEVKSVRETIPVVLAEVEAVRLALPEHLDQVEAIILSMKIAGQLAEMGHIGIYPVKGWWAYRHFREGHELYNCHLNQVNYSPHFEETVSKKQDGERIIESLSEINETLGRQGKAIEDFNAAMITAVSKNR
jgi:hypothetical protein